ncbi:cytochrome b/b6 domain-containing protein [Elstera litoralis]|uniref:cytochrome b/b6 domain-containing protein n=1 Tax=Elstera litoralis TaxID=552518 RepID=UPI000ACFAA6E|nr:hypothetical protein [Elstera litoralis]
MTALPSSAAPEVPVWDLGVRLFHWGTVAAVATAFLAEDGERLHEWAGYAVAGLVTFRLIWGLIGTRHARFSDFAPSPAPSWAICAPGWPERRAATSAIIRQAGR